MRLLILLAATALATSSAASPLPEPKPLPLQPRPAADAKCERTGFHLVDRWNGHTIERNIRGQKLGEQPPASALMAVFRTDEQGCLKPVIVRQNIGTVEGRAGADGR